jgi:hypothetical protein
LKREASRLARCQPRRLPRICARRDATIPPEPRCAAATGGLDMNSIVYIVGAVVIVIAILSFLGLR